MPRGQLESRPLAESPVLRLAIHPRKVNTLLTVTAFPPLHAVIGIAIAYGIHSYIYYGILIMYASVSSVLFAAAVNHGPGRRERRAGFWEGRAPDWLLDTSGLLRLARERM